MPKSFTDFSDDRNKTWCVYCGSGIGVRPTNRDHVPSKVLLKKPYPEDMTTIKVCEECNESYSRDEEYFAAFLSAVLTGSTEPSEQKLEAGRRIFVRNKALKRRIDRARKHYQSKDGNETILWEPEWSRIRNILTKNARAHVFFENGEPLFEEPETVIAQPLEIASEQTLQTFFPSSLQFKIWPEVGSVGMQRLLAEEAFDEFGFYVLQPGVYRFRLDLDDGVAIRSVLHEYLLCSVEWRF